MKSIIVCICIILLLTGCGYKEENEKHNHDMYDTYTTKEEDQFVAIEIPKLDPDKGDVLQKAMIDYVEKFLYGLTRKSFRLVCENDKRIELTNATVSDLIKKHEVYVEIESQIVLREDECVSVVFEGMYNCRSAAHPINLFFSFNFNPKTGERILYSDKYVIEDTLYEKCMIYIKAKYGEEINWSEYMDEAMLVKELSREETIFCYYTDKAVGISFPVDFALGSHLEIEIPCEELEKLKL